MATSVTTGLDADTLQWLADSPLFIDGPLVSGFYDAVVMPEWKEGKLTLSTRKMKSLNKSISGSGKAQFSLGGWLKTVFPFLDAKVEVSGSASREKDTSKTSDETVDLHPITTPQRQLVQLALHYSANLARRVRVVRGFDGISWTKREIAEEVPRALVFIDFPPGTMFIPMATELTQGNVVTLFDKLGRQLGGWHDRPPSFPDRKLALKRRELAHARRLRKKYWAWYSRTFTPNAVMTILENTIAECKGRMRWIDFRVPLGTGKKSPYYKDSPIHVHISSRGEYDTGVFAYNLVNRGFYYGVRLVGTLKSGPDINVLAIYEK